MVLLSFIPSCGGGGGGALDNDRIPPSTPAEVVATPLSNSSIGLSWNVSSDASPVYYLIYEYVDEHAPGTYVGSTADLSYSVTGLNPNTTYCFAVFAHDSWGNRSLGSNLSCATTQKDLSPPTAPKNLTLTVNFPVDIHLLWSNSTDDGLVAGYRIYRNGTHVKDVASTWSSDPALDPYTQYCYTVSAFDGAGNESEQSNRSCATTSWRGAIIDDTGDVGRYPSIALDPAGNAHVSYYDGTYSLFQNQAVADLKYATNASGRWVVGVVDSQGYAGLYGAISVDSAGKSHISYQAGSCELKYATNTSGAWTVGSIDNSVNSGYNTSVHIDQADKVHISYRSHNTVMYATNVSGSWTTSPVADANSLGGGASTVILGGADRSTSIGIDLNGNVHVSYYYDVYDQSFQLVGASLNYVTNVSGQWVTSVIDGQGDEGSYSSMALDTDGKAHISYYDRTNGDLKYATNATGEWIITVLDSAGDVGLSTSLALDAAGKVHISYYDETNGLLKYVTNTTGAWATFILDESTMNSCCDPVGLITDLAVDASGKVNIVYRYGSSLKYITNR